MSADDHQGWVPSTYLKTLDNSGANTHASVRVEDGEGWYGLFIMELIICLVIFYEEDELSRKVEWRIPYHSYVCGVSGILAVSCLLGPCCLETLVIILH